MDATADVDILIPIVRYKTLFSDVCPIKSVSMENVFQAFHLRLLALHLLGHALMDSSTTPMVAIAVVAFLIPIVSPKVTSSDAQQMKSATTAYASPGLVIHCSMITWTVATVVVVSLILIANFNEVRQLAVD